MEDHSMIINGEDNDSTSFVNSTISDGLSSSSTSSEGMGDDDDDDESSSSNLCSSSSSYDLSDLMAHLPIKRGLSKFYGGKSQSFTSLSRVTSIEDLPKKQTHYIRKMKASKSYGGGLDKFKSYTLPKPTIVKKASRISLLSSSSDNNCRGPLFSLHENLGCST